MTASVAKPPRPAPRAIGNRLAMMALAIVGGAALQLQQPTLWPLTVYVGLLVLAVLLAAVGRWRWDWCLPLAAAAAAFALTGGRAELRLADRLPSALEGRDLVLVGVVAQLPRRLPDGVRFSFDIESATLDGAPLRVPRRVSLGWHGGLHEEALLLAPYETLRAGQRWRFDARLRAVHGLMNPHGFDHELWMFEQGLGATGSVRATQARGAVLLAEAAGAPVERARQALRDAIERRVPDARAAGVLAALAVGDQAAIERTDWELFRTTGIAHLVSISGLHVTMFAWLAGGLVGALWRRSRRAMLAIPAATAARWGGVVAAAAYALLAGWGVPAQRTVWMLATAALLAQLGLRWPWPLVLLAVAAVIALIDPWALLQPGFWLSFVAVGLLLVGAPSQRDTTPAPTSRLRALVRTSRQALRTQCIATIGLAPLTLIFFQQVSLVGFVANLIAIPLVTLLITPLALLGAVVPPLWTLAALGVQSLSGVLAELARWPGALWTAAAAPAALQLAALAGAVLLVAPLPWRLRLAALPLMLPLFAPPLERTPHGAVEVLAADVGQGSAVLVRTRHHALLYDSGAQYARDSDAGARVLVPLLRALGVTRLDLLMLSHRDQDHVGGAASVLAAIEVAALSSSLEAAHALRAPPRPHARCEAGQHWQWDGVRFEVLHPLIEDYGVAAPRPNAISCVLAITDAAGRRVLLTGDIEAEQEARLVRDMRAALRSQVLLAPHHGSKTSSTAAFLEAAAPRTVIVQSGYRNRFGHPAPEVVERYRSRGLAWHASPACGAWQWRSDRDGERCERQSAARYWHHRP